MKCQRWLVSAECVYFFPRNLRLRTKMGFEIRIFPGFRGGSLFLRGNCPVANRDGFFSVENVRSPRRTAGAEDFETRFRKLWGNSGGKRHRSRGNGQNSTGETMRSRGNGQFSTVKSMRSPGNTGFFGGKKGVPKGTVKIHQEKVGVPAGSGLFPAEKGAVPRDQGIFRRENACFRVLPSRNRQLAPRQQKRDSRVSSCPHEDKS